MSSAVIGSGAELVNPDLAIADARHILIGNGPTVSHSGAQIGDGINRFVLSGDMVAVDAYCAPFLRLK